MSRKGSPAHYTLGDHHIALPAHYRINGRVTAERVDELYALVEVMALIDHAVILSAHPETVTLSEEG